MVDFNTETIEKVDLMMRENVEVARRMGLPYRQVQVILLGIIHDLCVKSQAEYCLNCMEQKK